jgi:hypothetical protein
MKETGLKTQSGHQKPNLKILQTFSKEKKDEKY